MERWRDISGYEGLYKISDLGRVYSIQTGIIRKTKVNNSGYELVCLNNQSKENTMLVHRLVAREFCEGYAEHLEINHKDADKLNNEHSNLEWVTRTQNIQDTIRRGTHSVKEAHKVAHEKRKRRTVQKSLSGEVIAVFDSAREAARSIGKCENSVSRCAAGKRKTAYGFKWEYEDDNKRNGDE